MAVTLCSMLAFRLFEVASFAVTRWLQKPALAPIAVKKPEPEGFRYWRVTPGVDAPQPIISDSISSYTRNEAEVFARDLAARQGGGIVSVNGPDGKTIRTIVVQPGVNNIGDK